MSEPGKPRSGAGEPVIRRVRALSFETQQYVDAVARRLGLHRSDVAAVGVLIDSARAGEEMSPGDLARTMNMSAAAVSALVDRLERAGHVRRERHETDGRRLVIERTRMAQRTSREMFRPLLEEQKAALAGYTEDEPAVAARVLADLTAASRRAYERPLPPPPED